MSTSPPATPRKLRILCLHGYTQSGPLFRSKTRALEKSLQKHFPAATANKPGALPSHPGGVEFHYVTAPHKLARADIPTFDSNVAATSASLGPSGGSGVGDVTKQFDGAGEEDAWGWWVKQSAAAPSKGEGKVGQGDRIVYEGLDATLRFLAETLTSTGPYDGVLGFSQGASLAVMLAALLEPGRPGRFAALREKDSASLPYPSAFVASGAGAAVAGAEGEGEIVHPPMRFAVSYSGFRAPAGNGMDAFYAGGLETPTLHFLGSVDTVVEEHRCLALVEACRGGERSREAERKHAVVYHPGGHFVPSQRMSVDALVGFLRSAVQGAAGEEKGKEGEEERVEDMDMPF